MRKNRLPTGKKCALENTASVAAGRDSAWSPKPVFTSLRRPNVPPAFAVDKPHTTADGLQTATRHPVIGLDTPGDLSTGSTAKTALPVLLSRVREILRLPHRGAL